jgi:TPR repeat protein
MEKPLARAPFMQPEGTSPESVDVPMGPREADAEFELGLEFASAGGSQNDAQAVQHYLKAAAQNHIRAQVNLSAMFAQGHGVRRDQAQCLMWLSKAAHLGDSEAQYTLGMKQNRISMDQEPQAGEELKIEAYKWLRLAAAQAYPEAETGCDFVSMGMTRESVIEGDRRAAEFVTCDQISRPHTAG